MTVDRNISNHQNHSNHFELFVSKNIFSFHVKVDFPTLDGFRNLFRCSPFIKIGLNNGLFLSRECYRKKKCDKPFLPRLLLAFKV